MAITTIDDKHLTNIATAIRQKSGVEDTFKPSEMASAIKNISGGEPILEEVVVQPSINEQTITPSADYDGLSQVKIGAVTSSIDSDIKPENIKKGVEILGVTGNIEDKPADPVLQSKIVEPSTGKQIITADSGYDGLRQVTVNEVTSSIDSNIKASNIKQGVSILGVQGTLEQGAEVVKKYKPQYIKFNSFTGTDLSEETRMLDTSLLTTMRSFFDSCQNMTNMDLSGFDTSSVTDMQNMFSNCKKLTSINVSNFNTEKVANMSGMFTSCESLTSLDLSNFNTKKVENMSGMLRYCSKLTSINVSNFNTEKVTDMSNMFWGCNNLTELDLSSFVTPILRYCGYMFYNCTKLMKLDMRNFTFGSATSYSSMFEGVPTNCLIIVKGETEKAWVKARKSALTNVKTLAEYQAEGGV